MQELTKSKKEKLMAAKSAGFIFIKPMHKNTHNINRLSQVERLFV